MKSLSKLVSAIILLALVLTVFPATGASSAQAAVCDWAGFVADVTVPDGSTYAPGATFTKTWRLRNIGTCTWTTNYALVFDSGAQMGAQSPKPFPKNVAPGETVDLTVDMTAPNASGRYFGYWKLRNANNVIFGIGRNANSHFWVEINVAAAPGTVYNFTEEAGSAAWSSGAGALSFPGTDGDAKGFGLRLDAPRFESGVTQNTPGLLMSPQNIYNGYIQATYPAFRVQRGDRFQATVGCEFNQTSCYVAYRLNYQIGNGPVRTFWTFRERYEGLTYFADLNLNALAGYDVKFTLFMSAYGPATGDRAIWGNPIIARAGGTTPPPTVTGTPPTATATSMTPTRTPTIPPSSCDKVQFVRDVTIPDRTTLAPGATFTKTWELKNVGSCTWTSAYQLVFYSGDRMGGPDSLSFPQNTTVAPGQSVLMSVDLTAPTTAGSYRGYWMFRNANGQLFGWSAQANRPWWVDIRVSGTATVTPGTATPTATTGTTTPGTATSTPTPTSTQSTTANWTTYQNINYGFSFKFPPGSVVATQTDTAGRIFLPITSGTNLIEKYIDVAAREGISPCQSPNPNPATSENVTINGRTFLKETGQGVATGNIFDWTAYSIANNDACISLTFVLHSGDPANSTTPPPEFDEAAESAVFTMIMDTFTLAQ